MLDNFNKLVETANNGDTKAWKDEMVKTGDDEFAAIANALDDFFNVDN